MTRLLLALLLTASWLLPGLWAGEHLPPPDLSLSLASPSQLPPFGADLTGRPLTATWTQGSAVVGLPAVLAGLLTALLAMLGGLLACSGWSRTEALVQGLGETVGALPRMVVVLVLALIWPRDQRSLMPIALCWALLAAPGAIDEAAAIARRLGGSAFVEALRAHGFSRSRVLLYHLVGLNLRPVIVRQGAEVMTQVVFLEIALSYLSIACNQPSLTHVDDQHSWAEILDLGYKAALGLESLHALALGMGLVALVAATGAAWTAAGRARA